MRSKTTRLSPETLANLLIFLLALAAISVAMAACAAPPPPPPAPEVTVAPVIHRQVAESDELTGHFEAVQSVEVRPRVGGFVKRVTFTEGATVRQGDPLFEIDPRPYQADEARASALLEQARTRQSLAAQDLERAKRLVTTQAISREELDARTSAVAEASGAVRAAEASLETAKLNIEWSTVRAPITGRVGRAEITQGNLVQGASGAASLLTTIVSLDPIYVYFDADEQLYLKNAAAFAALRSGGHGPARSVGVGLASETGFPHQGMLDFVDNQVDPTAGTIRVRAVVPNANHRFAPGLFARVKLADDASHDAALVQDAAIGTDQDRKFVLVLKPDDTVEYRAVTVGRVVDGLRVVQTGLAAGENVVINGQLRVRPGMKVVAKHATMQVATAPAAPAAR